MKKNIYISPEITIPEAELEFRFSRSSGPGGQNVNKVNSKAELRWHIYSSIALPWAVKQRFLKIHASRISEEGFFIITSALYRDQPRNIDNCRQKLLDAILSALKPPKKRIKTKPTRSSQQKRIEGKKQQSQKKQLRKTDYKDN